MKRLAALTLLAATVAGCRPGDTDTWVQLYQDHPRLAMRHLQRRHPRIWQRMHTQPPDDGVYWPWTALAECESNGNWHIATGNGYYGGLQFSLRSWQWAGGTGYPHHAPPSEQVRRGEILQDLQGWGAWPTCARQIGLL